MLASVKKMWSWVCFSSERGESFSVNYSLTFIPVSSATPSWVGGQQYARSNRAEQISRVHLRT